VHTSIKKLFQGGLKYKWKYIIWTWWIIIDLLVNPSMVVKYMYKGNWLWVTYTKINSQLLHKSCPLVTHSFGVFAKYNVYVFWKYTNEHWHNMFLNIEIKQHVNDEMQEFDAVQNKI
jgi:hypothetical protein